MYNCPVFPFPVAFEPPGTAQLQRGRGWGSPAMTSGSVTASSLPGVLRGTHSTTSIRHWRIPIQPRCSLPRSPGLALPTNACASCGEGQGAAAAAQCHEAPVQASFQTTSHPSVSSRSPGAGRGLAAISLPFRCHSQAAGGAGSQTAASRASPRSPEAPGQGFGPTRGSRRWDVAPLPALRPSTGRRACASQPGGTPAKLHAGHRRKPSLG